MANNCKDCKHDKGKCVGVSRAGSHRYCFEQKEMTNADRIRAMSDAELSQVLGMFVSGNLLALICDNPKRTVICDSKCVKCICEWLKQPAEVD